MRLADAIEGWGQANRSVLDDDQLQSLAEIWRQVRRSSCADVEVEALTKLQGRELMSQFDRESQPAVSHLLNRVRAWALEASATDAPTEAVGGVSTQEHVVESPTVGSRPIDEIVVDARGPVGEFGTEAVVVRDSTGGRTALVPLGDAGVSASASPHAGAGDYGVRAVGPTSGSVPAVNQAAGVVQGPVAGWAPPEALPMSSPLSGRAKGIIGAVIAVAGLALLVWIVTRDDATVPTETSDSVCLITSAVGERPMSRLGCWPGDV